MTTETTEDIATEAVRSLAGDLFGPLPACDTSDLRELVDDICVAGQMDPADVARRPVRFADALWQRIAEAGLDRLSCDADLGAGPIEAAVVLRGLAAHAGRVPLAESDLVAGVALMQAGLVPPEGVSTAAVFDADTADGRVVGLATEVAWPESATAITLIGRTPDGAIVASLDSGDLSGSGCELVVTNNLAGEPRGRLTIDTAENEVTRCGRSVYDDAVLRGGWARCVQTLGALDTAVRMTVTHAREREQFGRSLSTFQSVQHSLAAMAGSLERCRAATILAVGAAASDGFGSPSTRYATTVARVVAAQSVDEVCAIAHQLHGAIGTTLEHDLWQYTMRARSWVDEFGNRRSWSSALGIAVLDADSAWNVMVGTDVSAFAADDLAAVVR